MTANAMGLAGVDGTRAVAPHGVLATGHDLQVGQEVRTVPPGASVGPDVVDGHPLRDRAYEVLVGPSVGRMGSVSVLEDRVPLLVLVGLPGPALVVSPAVDVGPETGFVVALDEGRGVDVSVTAQATQVSRTETIGEDSFRALGAGFSTRDVVVATAQSLPERDVGATVFGRTLGFGHVRMVHAKSWSHTRSSK